MPSSLLPIELSAPFLVPTGVVPLASVCRALREATLNNATWTEVFARRYPCLAKLPGFDKPADARGLVKSLLAAAFPERLSTPPSGQGIPPVPRDAQGRAVPLRSDARLAVQLVRRAKSRAAHTPLLKLAAPLSQCLSEDGSMNWNFEMVFEPAHDEDSYKQLESALDLPRSIESRFNEADTRPPVDELIEQILTNFNQHIQQEVFVVYGDSIHRLDVPSAKVCDERILAATERMEEFFHVFFQRLNSHSSYETGRAPWFPVEVEVDANALMISRFYLGLYKSNDWDASYDGDQSFNFHILTPPRSARFEILADWDRREYLSSSTIHERRFEEDGGEDSWHWFCQLLAASPPVHFPRATS